MAHSAKLKLYQLTATTLLVGHQWVQGSGFELLAWHHNNVFPVHLPRHRGNFGLEFEVPAEMKKHNDLVSQAEQFKLRVLMK